MDAPAIERPPTPAGAAPGPRAAAAAKPDTWRRRARRALRDLKNAAYLGAVDRLPDAAAIAVEFVFSNGYVPDLRRPRTFNEKLQWRKLHDRNPLFARVCDKVEVKGYVAERLGPGFVPPTLWAGERPEDIPFDALPAPYVLKANHGSGKAYGGLFVLGKGEEDRAAIRARAAGWLARDYSRRSREWAYTAIPRRLLAEPYLGDADGPPTDLKFWVFGGRALYVQVVGGRGGRGESRTYYDRDWNVLPLERPKGSAIEPMPAPASLALMIAAAEALGRGLDFARVDLYEVDGRPLVGEITIYPGAGFNSFAPRRFDREFGDAWTLPGGVGG